MYAHTNSLKVLKEQVQEVINFAVLSANSVPLLKMTIKNIEKGCPNSQLANQDFFLRESSKEDLKEYAKNYKFNLSKYILLSSFSYFESYVTDAINEIFEFHEGFENMSQSTKDRCVSHINISNPTDKRNKSKLQDAYNKSKNQKYQKYTEELKKSNYKFPSELLSYYGVIKLKEELKNMKSVGIPDILVNGLHLNIKEEDIEMFHKIRDIRNSIAHGKNKNLDIKSAMKYNKFLRKFAVSIDKHIVNNYFVIEKFS